MASDTNHTSSSSSKDETTGSSPITTELTDQDTGRYKWKDDTRFSTQLSKKVDVITLEADLRSSVTGEVRFDTSSRALYSTDASNYRQIPIGVVLPKSEQDIINTISICNKHHAPVLSRGGGTSLAGQTCNVAVVMDMSKYYNKVLKIDRQAKRVTVQPGIVLDEMRNATKENAGLTFGPDPATHDHCTLGGMLGNNSCGIHSVMAAFHGYGARTSDNTQSLTIITYDGVKMTVGPTSDEAYQKIIAEGGKKAEIYKKVRAFRDKYAGMIRKRFPDIPRRVSGYNLPALLPENGFNVAEALVGSESTLVTILEAEMKLLEEPKSRSLLVLGFKSLPDAGYAVPHVLKFKPIGLEGMDDMLLDFMRRKGLNLNDLPLLPDGKAWLLVEFGGDSKEDSDNQAKALMKDLKTKDDKPNMSLFDDPKQEKMLWEIRESGLGATAWVPGEPNGGPGWEDSAVPPDKVGDYVKDLRDLFTKYHLYPSIYGHFGQGCIHCRVGFDFQTAKGIETYKKFTIEASHLVVKYGGSISGEHGDGQARGDLLEIMYGPELVQAFREFKSIWDPQWMMNPGKIVDTYGQINDLRLGTTYNPPVLKTHFKFPNENFSFARASNLCVGVGECRKHSGGTMCPSYMVTREEKHSTRGRSRLLFEMLQGDIIKDGWKSKEVKESLDLCLACKGCKHDCPVYVDMATYKAEFLSHYYEGRLRPRTAYAFGFVFLWSRIASLIPGIANFFMHAPVIRNVTKAMMGVTQKRNLPRLAELTFREWYHQNGRKKNSKKVILWTDTFNNYYLPQTLVAGKNVLEAAGFEVVITKRNLCCGRPLYDFGFLNTAKRMLTDIMHSMKEEIAAGVPIVGMEPSCIAVFRDELTNLFPANKQAKRLSQQVYTLAEFLEKEAPEFKVPHLKRDAIVHGHCHHKSIMKMDCDEKVLDKTGLNYNILDSGCCGMAGYFGYEKGDHYKVSIGAGERVLLPAVRNAGGAELIISDGFSCREQIAQETKRRALHLAEVIDMGLKGCDKTEVTDEPEKEYLQKMKFKDPHKAKYAAFMIGGIIAGFAGIYLIKRK